MTKERLVRVVVARTSPLPLVAKEVVASRRPLSVTCRVLA